jgi:hypothetical protein
MTPAGVCDIDLAAATPGMALAAALLDANGSVLVAQDAVLTEGMLAALHRRGVARCLVRVAADTQEEQAQAQAAAQERARAVQRLAQLFRHRDDCAGSALLLAQLRAYRSGEMP